MRIVLLAVLAMLLGAGVYARAESGGSPVITINPDGSITVVGDMPARPPVVEPVAPPTPPSSSPLPPPALMIAPEPSVAEHAPPVPKVKPVPPPMRQAQKKKAPEPRMVQQAKEPRDGVPPAGGVVSREDARRIALSVAPPSRGVNVYPADYNGLKVFQVVFKTEDGEQYVLVDRQSGEIVRNPKNRK